jgi:hypothetical protein
MMLNILAYLSSMFLSVILSLVYGWSIEEEFWVNHFPLSNCTCSKVSLL